MDGEERIPNAVLLPVLGLGLAAVLAAGTVVFRVLSGDGRGTLVMAGVSAALVTLAVGLWRRMRSAHVAVYVLAGLFALAGLAWFMRGGWVMTALGVGAIVGLSLPTAKAWFAIR